MHGWMANRPLTLLPGQDALDLLARFYAQWSVSLRDKEQADHAGLADWFSEQMDAIEQIVMGCPEEPMHLGMVAAAQMDTTLGAVGHCAVLSRAARFQKSLRFDSPHVAFFPTEEAALQAAEQAPNRCAAATLFLIHLGVTIAPLHPADGEQFTADTRVRIRAICPDPARR